MIIKASSIGKENCIRSSLVSQNVNLTLDPSDMNSMDSSLPSSRAAITAFIFLRVEMSNLDIFSSGVSMALIIRVLGFNGLGRKVVVMHRKCLSQLQRRPHHLF